MTSKKGLTLVEIMIVMAILAVLTIGAIVAINPMAAMAKARDAQRKKDLNRIKTSFEEYFNDRNCFPDQTLVDSLAVAVNCNSGVLAPWLTLWPCDPRGSPYPIVVGDDANCPKWFKIMTNLENKSDTQIFDQGGIGASLAVPVNYSVSSGNISNTK